MQPNSKSTEPLISSSKPVMSQFGQVSPDAWRVSGKTMKIDEYIEEQGQQVNSSDVCVLGTFTGRLLDKLKETNASEYPGLREAVQLIVRVLESPAAPASERSVAALVSQGWLCCKLPAGQIQS